MDRSSHPGPSLITQLLRIPTHSHLSQTGVAIKRIDGFLSEEEVPEEVSNLKPVGTFRRRVDNRLGIEHASFKWNEASTAAIQSRDVPINANSDRRFELKDINIVLPEEELTMVTGPSRSHTLFVSM